MYRKLGLILLSISFSSISFSQATNIALHKPVTVSSEGPGFPASNMVDGTISRRSVWIAANGKAPHIVEIDLKKYYTINEIKVHSGIMDSEKKPDEMTQAAGFWSVKNFKLQYWDDANWSDFPKSEIHENREVAAGFKYSPAVTTFKIRLVCDDGEPISIMEIEAFGTAAANMPEPPTVASSVKPQQTFARPQPVTITVGNEVVGKSLKYVGYNQGYYMPGSNTSGWVEYSNTNSMRVWTTLNSFVPEKAVQVDKELASVTAFDQRKMEIRSSPESNKYINWEMLLPLYDQPDSSSTNAMVFNYALTELKRLGVDVVLQIGSTDFEDNWTNKWKQWQRYYALAYYTAKKGDVTMFALQNEPNHRNSGPMKLDQWIMAMQIVSDAIHCAVEDVNKQYHKSLVPKFVGPVTAGQNTDWWAAISKAIRTDYHGNKTDKDLMEIFSTHSYNSPAVGYESRIDNIRKINQEAHPAHQALPIVYTEIGRWMNAYLIDKEETMDSPSLFTEWAGIYANNMKNGGYGMWAFKFANTASGPYPEGIKSGHHYVWHGQRIVEDAYHNLALGKPVTTSNKRSATKLITDGDKGDASTWVSDADTAEKWAVIDLEKSYSLGSAVVYTGDASGVYTSPERIRNFKLQFQSGSNWKDIPGAIEKDNKYAQLFMQFTTPVQTGKVRFVSTDKGSLKIREIKLFEKGDGPTAEASYDVSGIQRTGEVVRLFAKGFKDEKPLLKTTASVKDIDLDTYTSYDSIAGNYYMWLVQRGGFNYNMKIDLQGLNVSAGTPVTAELVNPTCYGEVSSLNVLGTDKQLSLTLSPQSVMLLTIPKEKLTRKTITATEDATVNGGVNSTKNEGKATTLNVQLNAAQPEKNQVAYIRFKSGKSQPSDAGKVVLQVNGYTDKLAAPFRLHVYAIPSAEWNAATLTWNNAPLLNSKGALIHEVGTKAFIAGEIAFSNKPQNHLLDVTSLMQQHGGNDITFVFVRETRQLGDDEDKGKKVVIQSMESANKPALLYWIKE